ncbi:hypothetical protein [Paraburkholderia sp. BL10I2N1]|uniref:hypothetical protein n=1 Tax=Paraburkholderia sp. BL10I2N1 TaxID=1938796 RepID=UPI0010E587D9|nr:hypothetical protein [Paraburkholderia sp. BL10I2N1]TDN57925.1 hypothetical protein B0G77_8777 [Paraburkholderia sp. BL10I2N1]
MFGESADRVLRAGLAGDPVACMEANAAHYRGKNTPSLYRPVGESEIRCTD